jgi:hypothetical protein
MQPDIATVSAARSDLRPLAAKDGAARGPDLKREIDVNNVWARSSVREARKQHDLGRQSEQSDAPRVETRCHNFFFWPTARHRRATAVLLRDPASRRPDGVDIKKKKRKKKKFGKSYVAQRQ